MSTSSSSRQTLCILCGARGLSREGASPHDRPPFSPRSPLPHRQLFCAYIIFIAAYFVAYREPKAGKKGGAVEEGEWAPMTEAGKLYLSRYGNLIEDFKVRAGGPFFEGCVPTRRVYAAGEVAGRLVTRDTFWAGGFSAFRWYSLRLCVSLLEVSV